MKSLSHVVVAFIFLMPMLAFGQAAPNTGFIDGWIDAIANLINRLIPLLIAIGVLFFTYGLVVFIASADDEAARAAAKTKMIWGVVALFVILGIWGFIEILQSVTGVDGTSAVQTGPAIPAP